MYLYTQINTHIHKCAHTYTDTDTHTRTHAHAHAHTRTRTHTHTHTHTHTKQKHYIYNTNPINKLLIYTIYCILVNYDVIKVWQILTHKSLTK